MKCIYCGAESEKCLCNEHHIVEVLDEVIALIERYASEHCDNPHVREYVESSDSWRSAWTEGFPELLSLFDEHEVEYERCYHLGDTRGEGFEDAATAYLDAHGWQEERSQTVMHMLLQAYSRKEFLKPIPYVQFIEETEGLFIELYVAAVTYKGMTGDYDDAADLIVFARNQVNGGCPSRWGKDAAAQMAALGEAEAQNEKWRAKRYWPRKSEQALAQLTEIYESRGIAPGAAGASGRTAVWPKRVAPADFEAPNLSGRVDGDFCALWLRDVPGRVKGVCELIAVKVEDGDQAGDFRSLVRPWKAARADKASAATCLGITYEEMDASPEVFEALPKLLEFADGLLLVIQGASQLDLLVRSARYSGLKGLENEVFVVAEHPGESGLCAEVLEGISGPQTSEGVYRFVEMRELSEPSFTSFVAFDTETTGFGRNDQITEIGAVRVVDGEIVERFQMLANPGKHIPGPVQELTGITDAMVAGAPDYKEVATAFKRFAGEAVLVGHNIGFDIRMLAQAALSAGVDFTNEYFDTNRYAKGLKTSQGWEKTKLGTLPRSWAWS